MITLKNASLRRGAKVLLDGADLTLYPGARVGVVGANGCGKSSVFSLLRGALQADRGDALVPRAWAIASVAQDTPATDRLAIDYVLDGDAELRALEKRLADAEHPGAAFDGEQLALLHERFAAIDGYTARARAATLLSGLGFRDAEHEQPVTSFSGGWRMRLNLAQALMCRSDLLLLDEPTNHLDLDAIVWLERWLGDYRGTMLIISHDREFLDSVSLSILHFDERTHAFSFLYTMTAGFWQDNISYHDCAEEAYHIWGTSWMMQFGNLPTGGYFWRPPYINHGAFASEHGVLAFGRTDGTLHNHFHFHAHTEPDANQKKVAKKLAKHSPDLFKWVMTQGHNHPDFLHGHGPDWVHTHDHSGPHAHAQEHEHGNKAGNILFSGVSRYSSLEHDGLARCNSACRSSSRCPMTTSVGFATAPTPRGRTPRMSKNGQISCSMRGCSYLC